VAKEQKTDKSPSTLVELCRDVRLTRRLVTQMLMSVGSVAAASAAERTARPDTTPTKPVLGGISANRQPVIINKHIVRPDDLLVLDLSLVNMKIEGSGGSQRLVPTGASNRARLIVDHQSQAIAEQAYFTSNTANTVFPPAWLPCDAYSAGPSRIVFKMPAGTSSQPFTIEGILDACRTWPMSLDYTARPWIRAIESGGTVSTGDIQDQLELYESALQSYLPDDMQNTLAGKMAGMAGRVGAAMGAAIKAGKPMSDADVSALIDREVDSNAGMAAKPLAQRMAAKRMLEASGTRAMTRQTTAGSSERSSATTARPSTTQNDSSDQQTSGREDRDEKTQKPVLRRRRGLLRGIAGAISAGGRDDKDERPTMEDRVQPSINVSAISEILKKPHEPGDYVTALEIPYRLYQSPLASGGWAHATGAVEHNGRTELWHTRLGTRKSTGVDDRSSEPLRAIWSPDYVGPGEEPPAETGTVNNGDPVWALTAKDRCDLVKLTAGYDETVRRKAYTPRPSIANRLMLTALGGWLDLDGKWPVQPDGVSIAAWSHRLAVARDYFVRVVYAGFLYPFGHAASLVKVTERRFQTPAGASGNARVAILRQRVFLVVNQPVRSYDGQSQPKGGSDLPFTSIEVVTKTTPNLSSYAADPQTFLVKYSPAGVEKAFLFAMVGTDCTGKRVAFTAPCAFVYKDGNTADLSAHITAYATAPTSPFEAAPVGFAEPADDEGDSTFPVLGMVFKGVKPSQTLNAILPQFFPAMDMALIKLPGAEELTQKETVAAVRYADNFCNQGNHKLNKTNNPAQVFLRTMKSSIPADFQSLAPGCTIGSMASGAVQSFAGMVSPEMAPDAISATLGPLVGDLTQIAQFSSLSPESADGSLNTAFSSLLPDYKLLGQFKLTDVLGETGKAIQDAYDALKATMSAADAYAKSIKNQLPALTYGGTAGQPDAKQACYTIERKRLKPDPTGTFVPDEINSSLLINSYVKPPASATEQPKAHVDGTISNFTVNLFGCLILNFDKLIFSVDAGEKPKIDVQFDSANPMAFGGPLEFVNTLRHELQGCTDPIVLNVSPNGITAGYTLNLPTIAVGAMSMQNIAIGAAFNLPFDGNPPSAQFNFCTRECPFLLTVSLYGGGGYFLIDVDTGGVRELELSLEFGAFAEIDLGVASGGVYIKGGFYFAWDGAENTVSLAAFVELGGHLSVIGLITVSLVFHLELQYVNSNGDSTLAGEASLTVEVEVLFFSTSVSVSVRREFAGSTSADPTFLDAMPSNDNWIAYCTAFA